LKFIGKTEELQKQKQRYRTFGADIHMESGLDKCAKAVFKKRKISSKKNLHLTSPEKYISLNRKKKHISILGLWKVKV